MTVIKSLTFGDIEVVEDKIYHFKDGIPGLAGIKDYFIIEREDLDPFNWLQACTPPHLSLMMLDPLFIDANYQLSLTQAELKLIDKDDLNDIFVRVLITVPDDPKQMTANMLAPVVFSPETKKAAQVVVDGNKDLLRVRVIKD